ncbi:MAG: MoaD/ThiS family protein [Thermoplasmata archaeon]
MVKVKIINDNREFEIPGNRRILDLLKDLSLNPDGYIVMINGKPVPEDEYVNDSDVLELLRVFSGG